MVDGHIISTDKFSVKIGKNKKVKDELGKLLKKNGFTINKVSWVMHCL